MNETALPASRPASSCCWPWQAALAAQELPGKFEGVTIDAKLIGGQQYEALYARIAEWEKATGAKVNILSKKNHFELDKEIKSDIASGSLNWCVGSNHSSFAPQYPDIYTDLDRAAAEGGDRRLRAGEHRRLDPRRQAGDAAARAVRRFGALLPEEPLRRRSQEGGLQGKVRHRPGAARHLGRGDASRPSSSPAPPDFYGTQFAGKEEAINGRFYEMLVAEGGEYLDKDGKPAFNSDAGVRALDWFVNLYKAKAVPAGTTNYLWDDLGQGFASGTVAINLDWPGWAGFFNDPKSSKVAGNVGVKVQPKGSSGKRTGWSGHHGFSVTENCANKEAAASLVWFLTNEDSQKLEAAAGPLPTRTAVWEWDIEQAEGRPLQDRGADGLPGSRAERLPGAADGRVDRDLQRGLSGAAGGDPRRQDVEGGARLRQPRRRRQILEEAGKL